MRVHRAPFVLVLLALVGPAAAQPRDLADEGTRAGLRDALARTPPTATSRYATLAPGHR
jgi:hypothetical protein